jgi:hypothetical protein
LDLLGFIRPNPDFSTGYGEKTKQSPTLPLPSRGFEPAIGLKYNTTSDFRKEFSPKNREVLIAVRHWAEPNKQI